VLSIFIPMAIGVDKYVPGQPLDDDDDDSSTGEHLSIGCPPMFDITVKHRLLKSPFYIDMCVP
jgi:hypothetical protein